MSEYECIQPFYTDTDGYTDRDREMFVCGVEFAKVMQLLDEDLATACGPIPIHRENESRIRMMCGQRGVTCKITPHQGYDGCETWSDLKMT